MKNIKRYIGLAQKTGSPVILCDPDGEDLVLLGIEHYEALISLKKEKIREEPSFHILEEKPVQEDVSKEDTVADVYVPDAFPGVDAQQEAPLFDQDIEDFVFEHDTSVENLEENPAEEEERFDLSAYDFPLESEKQDESPLSTVPKQKVEMPGPKGQGGEWSRAGEILAQKFQNLTGDIPKTENTEGIHYITHGQDPAQGIPYRQVDENLEWEVQETNPPHSDEPVFYEEPL